MSTQREPGFATLAVHAGIRPDPLTGARVVPVYQTTFSAFESVDHARDVFTLNSFGALPTEFSNPTVSALEERIATLEGGTAAVAVSSGTSAIHLVFQTLLQAGDECIVSRKISGASFNQFEHSFKNYGWHAVWVDTDSVTAIEEAITPRTKAIFVESISNPSGSIADIAALAHSAKRAGVPLIVDNTLATPYLLQPLRHGADIVVHAATAFLGGHSNAHGGVIVDGGSFNWSRENRYPKLTDPRPEYEGLVFNETFGNFAFAMAVRALGLRDTGALLSPTNAFLILNGIETLPLRMQKHTENARRVAEYLSDHPQVAWVSYAGLSGDRYHNAAKTYVPLGAGAVFTFGLKDGDEAALSFIENLQLLAHSAQVGSTRSTALHPSSTTHVHLTKAQKTAAGAGTDAIRLALGIEDAEDLIADIAQALDQL